MLNIIKVELFRLKKSVIFWVMFGIAAASPIITIFLNLIVFAVLPDMGGNPLEMLKSAGVTASLLAEMGQVSGDASLWAMIASAVVLSKEFVDGTMRNVMLANKSRKELFFAYLFTSLIVAGACMLAYFAVTLVVAAPIFGFDGMNASTAVTASMSSLAMGLFAMAFAQTCMCMFVFGVRKQWAAILFPLLLCLFGPTIFTSVVEVVTMVLAARGQTVSPDAMRWVPFVNATNFDPANIDGAIVGMNALYMAIFTAVFVVSGYYTFKKADLK